MTDDGAWPNLFIPGAAKAGTTSLHRYLDEHPEIFMSEEKEVHFFTREWEATEDDPDARAEALERYRARFADGAETAWRGESTPAYLHWSGVDERIHRTVPEARFVISLRDPIERALSDHLMLVKLWGEERTFEEAIQDELNAGREGERHIMRGRYDEHIERYIDTFGRENVHVVLLEDIKHDTLAVLESIASFLDVDVDAMQHVDYETVHNPQGQPKNSLAEWLLTDERVHKAARLLVPKRLRVWLGDHALVEKGEKPEIDPEIRARLAEVFEPSVARLETLLGRELPELRASWPEP